DTGVLIMESAGAPFLFTNTSDETSLPSIHLSLLSKNDAACFFLNSKAFKMASWKMANVCPFCNTISRYMLSSSSQQTRNLYKGILLSFLSTTNVVNLNLACPRQWEINAENFL